MPNLGFTEILVLLLLALLIFGAKRLPEIGQSMGKGIREFTRSLKDTQDSVMGNDNATRRMIDQDRSIRDEAPADSSGDPKRLSQ